MGREFELKYAASREDLQNLKERFPDLAPISMQTTYYDTPGEHLSALRWTFRLRRENDRCVCTLKTPAQGFGSNEWETECDELNRGVELLCSMGAPEQLREFSRAYGFTESCGARFLRLAGLIETGGATVELALDEGVLIGGGRELPFSEMEVELKAGSEDSAQRFAESLAASFGLEMQPLSKIARARALKTNPTDKGEHTHGL